MLCIIKTFIGWWPEKKIGWKESKITRSQFIWAKSEMARRCSKLGIITFFFFFSFPIFYYFYHRGRIKSWQKNPSPEVFSTHEKECVIQYTPNKWDFIPKWDRFLWSFWNSLIILIKGIIVQLGHPINGAFDLLRKKTPLGTSMQCFQDRRKKKVWIWKFYLKTKQNF